MKLTERDFENTPKTQEADGVYQFLLLDGKMFYRNIETGEIIEGK